MEIYIATQKDLDGIFPLVKMVWKSVKSPLDLYLQFSEIDGESAVFVVAKDNDEYVGFASVGLRYEYVEGTTSLPVAYLEGVAVKERMQGKGVAKELLKFCENWAKERQCTEFCSDCSIDNTQSRLFHQSVGFKEVGKIIHFVKSI